MLGFLRRLRRSLIEEGHLKKYAVYAIGEILLVMIGILLALQINNWNESRKTRATEQIYLIALKGEFEENLSEFDRALTENNTKIEAGLQLEKFTGSIARDTSESVLAQFFTATFGIRVDFNPSMSVLEDLVNSGKLGIISSDELRQRLSGWNASVQRIHTQEGRTLVYADKVTGFIGERGDFRRILSVDVIPQLARESKASDPANQEMVKEQSLSNYIMFFIATSRALSERFLEPTKLELLEIISLIEDEIAS